MLHGTGMTMTERKIRATPVYGPEKGIDTTFVNPTARRSYNKQFNALYTHRSKELKARVMKLAMPKWNGCDVNGMKASFVHKVLDVPYLKPVFMIGTTLADMKFKPDVLKEVELSVQGHFRELKELTVGMGETNNKIDELRKAAYSDPKTDKLWLEDESGRILLTGDILNDRIIVTGLVIGVLGMEIESGIFHVVDIVYPEVAPQREIVQSANERDGKLLLCSGLNISSESCLEKYEMLSNWIMGDLGDERALEVGEMMIIGNSIANIEDKTSSDKTGTSKKNKYTEDFHSQYNDAPVKYVDTFLTTLLSSVPVTILPGPRDVVEVGLPKQPIHKSLFHNASSRKNFKRLTDPTFYEINGIRILATSGENINDIMKYILPNIKVSEDVLDESIATESRLKIIEDSLLWQIIAPTAPDTLWCYPFEDRDPFTLTETPHVYIVGNQPKFETSMVEFTRKNGDVLPVRIISLPEFSETGSCIMLDLKTLTCEHVKIEA